MRRNPPILPTEACPTCGEPLAHGCRRCYRCSPAGKRGPGKKFRVVIPRATAGDAATDEEAASNVSRAESERIERAAASHRWHDLTARDREKFARLAAEERERTARERHERMNRK
jgi:hypothetical protein